MVKTHGFERLNEHDVYKIHFFFGEKILVALDILVYAKKMNPPSIVLGAGGARQGWGQVQYLYLSTYLSVLDVLEYLVYGNVKVLVLVFVLDHKVLGTYK